jgi:predicted nucleic acid-binding protein
MRAFIDTSTLIKKYKIEPGRDRFLKILEKVSEIAVSPITYIEIFCSIKRNCHESHLKKEDFLRIKEEIDLDFGYFYKIPLNEDLERIAFDLCQKYQLRSLDLIQISSAKISQAKIFLTSDKLLHKIASQELRNHDVEFVG